MLRTPNKVLLVTPHPDDAEGGCGGTVAKWIREGAEVVYVLCTNGDKGTNDREMSPERLAAIREVEQSEAARVLVVKEVVFLRHPDGELQDDRQFREEVVREIRRHRPDTVMCLDHSGRWGHSHRDHRASAQVTMDAVCTYAWRGLYFPEHIKRDGLQPHVVSEIYLWGSGQPNTYVDISTTLDLKARALSQHTSQIGDPERTKEHIRDHARRAGERCGLEYAEAFRVVTFSPDSMLVG